MWGRLWSQTCALKACFRAGMGCFLQLKMFYCFKKMQGEKKSINIPLQSSLWNPQISIYLSSRGLWLSALILHLVDCEITISLASAVPVPGAVQPEGMIQREREVSTSKAREETVAAVSNTITPRTSIFYLMSNTLGLCETNIHIRDSLLMCRFRQIVKNGACLKEIRGKRANIEHSRTNEMLFRKTSQCHSSDVAMTKKGKKQEQTRNCVWLRLCTRSYPSWW